MLNAITAVKNIPTWAYWIAAAGVVYIVLKKDFVKDAAAGVVAGAINTTIDVVKGAREGVRTGVGDVLGIPRNNESLCKKALLASSTIATRFEALKYCSQKQLSNFQYLRIRRALTGRDFSINEVFK